MEMKCILCGAMKADTPGQWWHLRNYFMLTGCFCPSCWDKVEHDSFGKPMRPLEYRMAVAKILDWTQWTVTQED